MVDDEPEVGRAPAERSLVPVLGLLDVTMIVMGSIVGAGIFYTPSAVASEAGTRGAIYLVWCLGGLFAMTGAFVFAELGGMFPRTGGQYIFVREGIGRFAAFVFGWILLTAIASPAIAFVAGVFVDHGEQVVRAWEPAFTLSTGGRHGAAMALILLMMVVNIRGVRHGALLQNAAMSAKILGLSLIVVLGALVALGALEPRLDEPAGVLAPEPRGGAHGLAAIGVALLGAVFSYGGWQNVTAIGSEIREARRTLPRGIVIGALAVIVLYVTLNASLVSLLGVEGLAACTTPVATAAGRVLPLGEPLVAGLVMISTLAVCQALLMLVPRVLVAMSLDGLFFRSAGWVHPRLHTPVVAIAIVAAAALAHVVLADTLQDQLEITTLADTVFMALCAVGLFVLRRTRPDAERSFRCPGYPWIPAIFLLFASGLVVNAIFNARADGVWLVGGLFVTGVVLYWFWSSRSTNATR